MIHVPYRLRKAFRKIHPRLVRELEKKFSGKVELIGIFCFILHIYLVPQIILHSKMYSFIVEFCYVGGRCYCNQKDSAPT